MAPSPSPLSAAASTQNPQNRRAGEPDVAVELRLSNSAFSQQEREAPCCSMLANTAVVIVHF
jgi:hypothetical protein